MTWKLSYGPVVLYLIDMKFIQGQNREQTHLFPISLDQVIEPDNEVRIIDLFVDSLDIGKMGFDVGFVENGRPAYHPSDLLKLYIYGYMNRIRSSRQLEKESKRNIEVMWLIHSLSPDHNTISNFRKNNPKAIKKVFRETVRIARNFELIGGKLLAGNSTKLRAQNSKKDNYNQKKIDRHIEYIENKIDEHNKAIAENDGDKQEHKKEIEKHENRKEGYEQLEQQLKQSGLSQISTSDPDSRHMITRNNITEVAYNAQTTVDDKNNLPIDYKVTNANDCKAMGNMLQRAKSILGTNKFTALYDKGYHTGSEFDMADKLGIKTIVAIPGVAAHAPDPAYNVEHFKYYNLDDCYICPRGHRMITTGKLHQAKTYQFKRYTTKACKSCEDKYKCSKAKYGKAIQRSEYQELIKLNKDRVNNNQNYYRRRQAIVEHPYGTIKRQWGFNYIITKKFIHRAEADLGLIMNAYNLRRLINIIGKEQLVKYLQSIVSVLLTQNSLNCFFSNIVSYLIIKINYYHYFQFVNKTAIRS